MSTQSPSETFLGSAELCSLLGVTRQRIAQITKHPDFPPPRAVLTMGSIWDLATVTTWAETKGRTLNLDALRTPTS